MQRWNFLRRNAGTRAMTSTDMVMVATHDHRLVALSVVVSILAADAAIALAERIGDAHGRTWLTWLVGGATVDRK